MPAPYRVIQWATGSVGGEALRAVLVHPQLELAGVRVYSDDKEGRDAGELCGAGPTGIRATQDADALLAAPADCVLYMPRHADLDEVCALLASGKNVIATPFLFYGEAYPEPDRSQLARACAQGNSSLHGTGIHPGFIGTVLPLALSGVSRRIERLHDPGARELDPLRQPAHHVRQHALRPRAREATLDGQSVRALQQRSCSRSRSRCSPRGSAPSSTSVTDHQELVAADEALRDPRRPHRGGTVCGQRYRWRGIARGRVLIEIEALWTVGPKYPDAWPKPRDGWTIRIEGDPSVQLHFMLARELRPPRRAVPRACPRRRRRHGHARGQRRAGRVRGAAGNPQRARSAAHTRGDELRGTRLMAAIADYADGGLRSLRSLIRPSQAPADSPLRAGRAPPRRDR